MGTGSLGLVAQLWLPLSLRGRVESTEGGVDIMVVDRRMRLLARAPGPGGHWGPARWGERGLAAMLLLLFPSLTALLPLLTH